MSENTRDSIRNGKFKAHLNHKKGQDNPDSKLTNENVIEIIENFSNIEQPSRRKRILYYADKFCVSYSCIRGVVDGVKWKHLTDGIKLD